MSDDEIQLHRVFDIRPATPPPLPAFVDALCGEFSFLCPADEDRSNGDRSPYNEEID